MIPVLQRRRGGCSSFDGWRQRPTNRMLLWFAGKRASTRPSDQHVTFSKGCECVLRFDLALNQDRLPDPGKVLSHGAGRGARGATVGTRARAGASIGSIATRRSWVQPAKVGFVAPHHFHTVRRPVVFDTQLTECLRGGNDKPELHVEHHTTLWPRNPCCGPHRQP